MVVLQNKLEQLFKAGLAGGHYDNGAEVSSDTEEVNFVHWLLFHFPLFSLFCFITLLDGYSDKWNRKEVGVKGIKHFETFEWSRFLFSFFLPVILTAVNASTVWH